MRDVDPYELLVRWYLRFNGYLGVENFVVHETVQGGNVQRGETDVLAVRFPYSREDPGFAIQTDPLLLDQQDSLTDFVVAEVKGRRRDTLNSIWRPPLDSLKVDRVAYLVRWLGPFSDEAVIRQVATELQASYRTQHGDFSFRVLMFAHKRQAKLTLKQITFYEIAHFFVHVRAPSWQDHGFGCRSPHDQWHPLIKDIWKIADPQVGPGSNEKIHGILEFLKKAAEPRTGADSANA